MFEDVIDMTDERALIILNELAKTDSKALHLMANIQNSKDFGERDQLLCKMHRYIMDRIKHG
jgi:hypothetical protein